MGSSGIGDFMVKLFPKGPIIPPHHFKQRVLKAFPTLDPSAQKAIIKFIMRVNAYREFQGVHEEIFHFRITDIANVGGFIGPHRVDNTISDAWRELRRTMTWNEKRDHRLSQGEEDIGEATYYCTKSRLVIKRNKTMTVFGFREPQGAETLLPVPEGWENAPGVFPPDE